MACGAEGKASGRGLWHALAARSGTKRGQAKAIVALARKLAVIWHTLWRRDEDYDPLCGLPRAA